MQFVVNHDVFVLDPNDPNARRQGLARGSGASFRAPIRDRTNPKETPVGRAQSPSDERPKPSPHRRRSGTVRHGRARAAFARRKTKAVEWRQVSPRFAAVVNQRFAIGEQNERAFGAMITIAARPLFEEQIELVFLSHSAAKKPPRSLPESATSARFPARLAWPIANRLRPAPRNRAPYCRNRRRRCRCYDRPTKAAPRNAGRARGKAGSSARNAPAPRNQAERDRQSAAGAALFPARDSPRPHSRRA